ncbi:MAG: Na+/H+ antiporter NhaC family protein [Peptoniphilaceae bacterium]|uniref:Na+/H+ antiporter NhaC family protein n=1 Tax=Peptoniphilus sp. TaxID=1971214 RepID=UPI002975C809|nr:Na+/H+ antiporter NhaC family protein [Peptoniphilus sp.]MDD7352603.1 Na+/H+ antiporter NhaC family protein [Peptoniphilaceae bacterium]MDY3902363.1 Na+/H+ antiporter NhaC family protein [Peptoniphilus sp.]
MEFGILSIVPPIVAIALALITKEVITSLLIGILSGGLIYTGGNIIAALETVFDLMGKKLGDNALMLVFLAMLGSLVMVMNMAGGSFAYGKWASKKIKSKKMAKLATSFLGILIFIDDYFNCLTVGAVMKPIVDENKVSRAKLAHIIDSTAAPVCILAPVSSWAASVVAVIGDTGVKNPMSVFLSTIPMNVYPILTLLLILYFCTSDIEIGVMEKYELNDTSRLVENEDVGYKYSKNGKVYDLVVPILVLIFVTVMMMLKTGGFFTDGVGAAAAFGDANVNLSLVIGAFFAIVVSFLLFIPRKLLKFEEFMKGIVDGMKTMVSAIVILSLAWTIGGITSDEFLNTGSYIASLISNSTMPMWLLPAIIFVVGAFLSFSTGTAWGTFGILIPIMVPILMHTNHMHYLTIVLAAIFSGSVFGDHCSPISDTTILSSAGAGCDHIAHVSSQLPYAISVGVASALAFLISGIIGKPTLTLPIGILVLAVIVFVLRKMTIKKYLKNEN